MGEGWPFLWAKRPWREAITHSHRLPRRSMSKAITRVPFTPSCPVRRKIYFCLPSNDVPVSQLTLHGIMLTFICLENTELCLNIYRISATFGFEGKYSFLAICFPFFLNVQFSMFDSYYIRISSVSICNSSILNSAA